MMKNILSAVLAVKHCQFASVEFISEVKMNKKGNPYYGRVQRVTKASLLFYSGYHKTCLARQKEQTGEQTFTKGSLPWGSWVVFNKIITHNRSEYLRFYRYGKAEKFAYLVDGEFATEEQTKEIALWDKAQPFFSAKQARFGILKKQVEPVSIKVENLVRVALNHQVFESENAEKYSKVG